LFFDEVKKIDLIVCKTRGLCENSEIWKSKLSIKIDRSRNFGTRLSYQRSVKYAGVRGYSRDASDFFFFLQASERASCESEAKLIDSSH